MNPQNRAIRWMLIAMVGLIFTSAWRYGRLVEDRSTAEAAAEDLAQCEHLRKQIQELDQRARQGEAAASVPLEEWTRRIEQSAHDAQIGPKRLVRIWPQPVEKTQDAARCRQAIQVLLNEVSLRQMITFLYTLESAPAGLRVAKIQLSAAQRSKQPDLHAWTGEATLFHIVYDPTSAERAN